MCSTDCCDEAEGITIPTGEDGSDGQYGGFSSDWLFDTNTGSAPGSTFLRFNNATYSSVGTIYISETNASSTNLANFLGSFSNGGGFGFIRIFDKDNSNKFWLGELTAIVDSGTYRTLTVTYITHNGTFAANDSVVVTFCGNGTDGSTGATGAAGTNGTNGTTILYNGTTQASVNSNSPAYANLDNYTVAGGTLTSNGDKLKTLIYFTKDTGLTNYKIKTVIDNNSITNPLADITIPSQATKGWIELELSRKTSTTAFMTIKYWSVNGINEASSTYMTLNNSVPVVWSMTTTISAQYQTDGADNIYHEQLTVEFYKK